MSEQLANPIPARPENPDPSEDRAFADLVKRHIGLSEELREARKIQVERDGIRDRILAMLGDRPSVTTLDGNVAAWKLIQVKEHLVKASEYQRLTVIPGSPAKPN